MLRLMVERETADDGAPERERSFFFMGWLLLRVQKSLLKSRDSARQQTAQQRAGNRSQRAAGKDVVGDQLIERHDDAHARPLFGDDPLVFAAAAIKLTGLV